MDIPSHTSDRMLDDTELERQDSAFSAGGQASITPSIRVQLENGECPWCQSYTGEFVGRHASSAHPDEWKAHKGE